MAEPFIPGSAYLMPVWRKGGDSMGELSVNLQVGVLKNIENHLDFAMGLLSIFFHGADGNLSRLIIWKMKFSC